MNLCAFALNWLRKAVDELRIRPKFPATHVHAISIEGDTKESCSPRAKEAHTIEVRALDSSGHLATPHVPVSVQN
jgi:hypothetical protein